MIKRISILLLLLLSICISSLMAESTLSQQYALSLSYTITERNPISGFMKTALSSDKNDYTSGLKADSSGADIFLSARFHFGRNHGMVKALNDTILTEKDRLSFFTDISFEMNTISGFGNTYTGAISIGQDIILGKGFYKAGISYELGVYSHTTTFEGFHGSVTTFNPIYGVTFSSNFGDRFLLDLSLITKVPFYYPKQTTYGFRLTSAFNITESFNLGYDGYLLLSDYIGETEFINRSEHTIFLTWRFGL